MRVLFLTLYPAEAASPRYRVTQFLPALEAAGFDCTLAAPLTTAQWRRHAGPTRQGRAAWYHLHETPARLRQILVARHYDAVFLQKAVMSAYLRGMAGLLRRCAPRLIYDIDDAVHLQPPHPLRRPWSLLEDRAQITKLMRCADHVLAGNTWLLEAAQAAGGKAALFPTVVDTRRFVPAATQAPGFRIGWIGTPSTTPALALMGDCLTGLPDATLQLVGADPKRVDYEHAEIVPWRYDKEVAMVQQFSVGVMPLQQDAWSRGKCALKALLYMACGVPCIATPHGAVLDIIRHGENGFFAETAADWRHYLEALRDPALRRQIGQAGRATVEDHYALVQAAPKLCALLKGDL